jgi:release factor glutamine methyltransferase
LTVRRAVCGVEFDVFPGVYDTGVDTELMAQAVRIARRAQFLEVGCGCGAVSLLVGRRCAGGIGVDINPVAVANAEHNRARLDASQVQFRHGDGFGDVAGEFDVVICNPPYNRRSASDPIERMFWDPADDLKRRFFQEVRNHLRRKGRVYFGWANFPDIEPALPLTLAAEAGLAYVRHFARPSGKGIHQFLVFEFRA